MTRLHILLVTVVLGLSLGWMAGRRYFTYVLFVGVEPTLYPCPYADVPEGRPGDMLLQAARASP